ncbi:MAG: hypothetical protein HYX27_10910 [Acidobacteria bacterium]|nr:hypothetical protein [Acidobacteriota bacterium]
MMSRIHLAVLCYLALAAIAMWSLRGDFRLAVLIFLGGLALKTWIAHRKQLGTALGRNSSTMQSQPVEIDAEIPEK